MKEIEIIPINRENTLEIPLCLKCKRIIPELNISASDNGIVYITMKCHCNNEIEEQMKLSQYLSELSSRTIPDESCSIPIHSNHKIQSYCANNCTWICDECESFESKLKLNHIHFNHIPFDLFCATHLLKLKYYCTTCKENICNECKITTHKNDKVIINPANDSKHLIDLSSLDNSMNKFKEVYDSFIEIINKEIEIYTKYKQSIERAYEQHTQENNSIRELLELINKTITKTRRVYSSQLKASIDSITLNTDIATPLLFNDKIEINYLKTLQFFNNNFIIKISKANTLSEVMKSCNGISSVIVINEKQIALSDQSRDIAIWDNTSFNNNNFIILSEHQGGINCLLLLKENIIASGSDDHKIIIWDLITHSSIATLDIHTQPVTTLVNLNGDHFASGSREIALIIWSFKDNPKEWQLIQKYKCDGMWLSSVIQLNTLELCLGSSKGVLSILDLRYENSLKKNTNAHSTTICSMVQLKNRRIVTYSFDETIKIWNFPLILVYTIKVNSAKEIVRKTVIGMVQLNHGDFVSIDSDNVITVWDTVTFEKVDMLNVDYSVILYVLNVENKRYSGNKGTHVSSSVNNSLLFLN